MGLSLANNLLNIHLSSMQTRPIFLDNEIGVTCYGFAGGWLTAKSKAQVFRLSTKEYNRRPPERKVRRFHRTVTASFLNIEKEGYHA